MTVKKLVGPDDFNECMEIVKSKQKTGGTTSNNLDSLILSYNKYFSNSDLFSSYQAYGYVDNDKIISFIVLAFIENMSRGKFWIMPAMYTTKLHNIFSFNNPEIGLLIKTAFENAEKNKYYEYYYTIAEHVSEVYERQINKTKYIPLYRYDRINLAVVPKNTVSTVDLYAKLIGEPKPHDMIIKKRILKEEFRINK